MDFEVLHRVVWTRLHKIMGLITMLFQKGIEPVSTRGSAGIRDDRVRMNVLCPFCGAEPKGSGSVQRSRELSACDQCFNPVMLETGSDGVFARRLQGVQDTREILREDSLAGRLLNSVRHRIDELPILPEMSHKIIGLCADKNASIQDLARLVSQDPVVASRVIQVANSAYYRGLSEITAITTACARLGMRTAANTAQSIAMNNVFRTKESRFTESMQVLWRHSVAVAHLSSEIAILLSIPHSEMVYLMGLLHDIGKIALIQTIADAGNEATKAIRESEEDFYELLDRFHCLVGLHVALRWGLPADFVVGIYYHHSPESAPSRNWKRMAHVVTLADSIAHVTNCPSERALDVSLIENPSAALFALNEVKLATLRVNLEERMDAFIGAIA